MDPDKSIVSDDDIEEEDDEEAQELQKIFVDNCSVNKNDNSLFVSEIPKNIELMFIIFSFYREDLNDIAISYNCKLRIIMGKVRITSAVSQEEVEKCSQKVKVYLQKIKVVELQLEEKFKIFFSSYFHERARERKFGLTCFNSKIYCHSKKLEEQELKKYMRELFIKKFIFVVTFKPKKQKDREIYRNFRNYLKKIIDFSAKEAEEREVIVQIGRDNCRVNFIGQKQRDLIAVKNEFKNVLQSTATLIISFQEAEGLKERYSKINSYSNKISVFPIHVQKLENKMISISSKQSILKKLIQKQKFLKLLKLDEKSEIGMFQLKRYQNDQRKNMIGQICAAKGYDFTTLGGQYYFFKRIFVEQSSTNDLKELLALLKDVLENIKEAKQSFQIPAKYTSKIAKSSNIEVTEGEYYEANQTEMDNFVSDILRRDVMRTKLKMSKPCLVRYKNFEAPSPTAVYWYENEDKQKVECQVADMKAGVTYFKGERKQLNNEKVYFFQAKLTII